MIRRGKIYTLTTTTVNRHTATRIISVEQEGK